MLVRFKLNQAPGAGQVCVVGSAAGLGAWNPEHAPRLQGTSDGFCTKEIELKDAQDARDLQYKFTIGADGDARRVDWETGENRRVNLEHQFNMSSSRNQPNVQTIITVEDKGFNHKSDNWPKIRTQ